MVGSITLLSCVLAAGQPAPGYAPPGTAPARPIGPATAAPLAPQLPRSQELVYRGTYNEDASSGGVQFHRAYRIESRLFVMESTPKGCDVAFLTTLKPRDLPPPKPTPGAPPDPVLSSVRLEVGKFDAQGKLITEAPGVFLLPLDGAPTAECGMVVELPPKRLAAEVTWETNEPGRPVRSWTVAGSEQVTGVTCVKVVGRQQSEDWNQPRNDQVAWRRTDTVWLSPGLGIAYRVERVVERLEPGQKEVTQKSVLRYELESSLRYPGQMHADRAEDIEKARAFAEAALPLLATPQKYQQQLQDVARKIDQYLKNAAATPYRDGVTQIDRLVAAGLKGEPYVAVSVEKPALAQVAHVGQLAPNFVAPLFGDKPGTFTLKASQGKPVVLAFYRPSSMTAAETLRYCARLQKAQGDKVTVVGLAMSDDAKAVLTQRDQLGLGFPLANGNGLRITYDVETTPKFVVIDGKGFVRCQFLGWGAGTPQEIEDELRHCTPKP